jgi:hypothetical protein
MSLRATGEGHISSIEFRTGITSRTGDISVSRSRALSRARGRAQSQLPEDAFHHQTSRDGLRQRRHRLRDGPLKESFTRMNSTKAWQRVRENRACQPRRFARTLECIQWLADSNYELRFSSKLALSERIIFPVSPNESNGIEDARFVRFTDDDGSVMYCATYTAYNGRAILPQFIETQDFLHFRVLTLNGSAVQNKGMACSRAASTAATPCSRGRTTRTSSSCFPTTSTTGATPDHPAPGRDVGIRQNRQLRLAHRNRGRLARHHPRRRPHAQVLHRRRLLDLNDPTKVIGRLREPLLWPEGNEREGYVPNVVYSCGSMLHGRELILPYAMSDKASAIASLSVDELLDAGVNGGS